MRSAALFLSGPSAARPSRQTGPKRLAADTHVDIGIPVAPCMGDQAQSPRRWRRQFGIAAARWGEELDVTSTRSAGRRLVPYWTDHLRAPRAIASFPIRGASIFPRSPKDACGGILGGILRAWQWPTGYFHHGHLAGFPSQYFPRCDGRRPRKLGGDDRILRPLETGPGQIIRRQDRAARVHTSSSAWTVRKTSMYQRGMNEFLDLVGRVDE
jgi:hypothetical protein